MLAKWYVYVYQRNAGKCILSESGIHDVQTFLGQHAPDPLEGP